MNSHDDEKTMVFTPVEEEKKVISRENVPEFNDNYIEEELINEEENTEEKGSKAIIYTILILCILLVIAVTAVIVLLSSDKEQNVGEKTPDIVQGENVPPIQEDEEENEIAEEIEMISCSVVFYGESAVESEEGYVITAKMTDYETQRQKKKHLLIDDETEIRLNGKRIDTESFIYLLEEKNEEELVFDSWVDDEKGYITYISFDGDLSEKEEEPIEEPPEEAETEEEKVEKEEIIEGINLENKE